MCTRNPLQHFLCWENLNRLPQATQSTRCYGNRGSVTSAFGALTAAGRPAHSPVLTDPNLHSRASMLLCNRPCVKCPFKNVRLSCWKGSGTVLTLSLARHPARGLACGRCLLKPRQSKSPNGRDAPAPPVISPVSLSPGSSCWTPGKQCPSRDARPP